MMSNLINLEEMFCLTLFLCLFLPWTEVIWTKLRTISIQLIWIEMNSKQLQGVTDTTIAIEMIKLEIFYNMNIQLVYTILNNVVA